MNKLKYILSNAGRFHHFEVAKILYKRNQLAKVICGYPWFKLKKENIPKKFVESHGLFTILRKPITPNPYFQKLNDFLNILNAKNIDRITCNYIDNYDEADVLIGLAKVGLNAGKKMIKNNKIYICERASSHIVFQNNILLDEYKEYSKKKFKMDNWYIDRELKEYENADIILVPSNFVKKTFDEFNINKVKVLEFGINVENFFPNTNIKKSQKYFDILFIGQLSLRKGLHYLIEAFHQFKHPYKRLHIIGSHTRDKAFFNNKIKHENIIVYGHIHHLKLSDIINKCHVFVLPSIEEGMAYVTSQAASSGCPLIVTEHTGAAEFVRRSRCGFVVPIRNSNAIADKLHLLADDKNLLNELSFNAINYAKGNTWSDYVTRLDNLILEFKKNK